MVADCWAEIGVHAMWQEQDSASQRTTARRGGQHEGTWRGSLYHSSGSANGFEGSDQETGTGYRVPGTRVPGTGQRIVHPESPQGGTSQRDSAVRPTPRLRGEAVQPGRERRREGSGPFDVRQVSGVRRSRRSVAPTMPSAITRESAGGVSVSSAPTMTRVGQVIVASVARLSGGVRSASSASITPSAGFSVAQLPHLDRHVRIRSAGRGPSSPGSMASKTAPAPSRRGDTLQRHAAGPRLVGVRLGPRVGKHEAADRGRSPTPALEGDVPAHREARQHHRTGTRVIPPGRARRWHGRSRGVQGTARGDLPKPRRSGAMPRQPARQRRQLRRPHASMSGNACRNTMGVPSPALRDRERGRAERADRRVTMTPLSWFPVSCSA